jgi:hypothetical protein
MSDEKIWCVLCQAWIKQSENDSHHYLCPGYDNDLLPPSTLILNMMNG